MKKEKIKTSKSCISEEPDNEDISWTSILTPEDVKRLPDWIIPLLDKEQIKYLTPEQVKYFTPEQIKYLTPEQIKYLTPEQIKHLTPEQLRHLEPRQLTEVFKLMDKKRIKSIIEKTFSPNEPKTPTGKKNEKV